MSGGFERPATIALPEESGAGLALDGLYVPVAEPRAAAVIAPPHPLMGGSMTSPVVSELAWASERAGLSSLRFDWRGVGASAGTPSGDHAQADEDFESASLFMQETVGVPLVAAGYSFGALAALRYAHKAASVDRMVLVAPPSALLNLESLLSFSGQILVVAGQDDEWVDVGPLGEATLGVPGVRIELFPECDHFFMTHLGPLSRSVEAWLKGAD